MRWSPRENSVLGLPWIAAVRPLFMFEGPIKSAGDRLVIRLPSDPGNAAKPYFRVAVRDPVTKISCDVGVALDTGAPYSTFPAALLGAGGLGAPRHLGDVSVFTWFDSETRDRLRLKKNT